MNSALEKAAARFRALKARMESALLGAGASSAKAADWDLYPGLFEVFSWSIDKLIEDNGYTTGYETPSGTVTLASALRDDIAYVASTLRAAGVTEYNKAKIFYNDKRALFLPDLPLSGAIDYFCNGAARLRWLPRLDFSKVTSMTFSFNNCGLNGTALYDEYEIDLSSCAKINYCTLDFARKIVFKNMGDACQTAQLFNVHKAVTQVEGMNMTYHKAHTNALFSGTSLTRLVITGTLWSVSSIRSSLIVEPDGDDTWFDKLDDESLHSIVKCAYDWETNPEGATKVEYVLSPNGAARYYTYYNFHFSASVKERLAAAYPGEDLESELAAKGWGM